MVNEENRDEPGLDSALPLHALGAIDGVSLLKEIEELAGTYGWYSELLLQATRRLASASNELAALESHFYLHTKKSAEISNAKVTERQIRSATELDDTWQKLNTEVLSLQEQVDRWKAALKTLDKKERMLDLLARFQVREYGINQRSQ